jgi:hypothetical protein
MLPNSSILYVCNEVKSIYFNQTSARYSVLLAIYWNFLKQLRSTDHISYHNFTVKSHISLFLSPFFSLISFYLLIVGEEGHCCTWSPSVTLTLSLSHTHRHKHTHTPTVGLLWTRDRSVAETSTWKHATVTSANQTPGGILTRNPTKRGAADLRLRTRDHCDRTHLKHM